MDALRYAVMSRPYLPEVLEERNETQHQRLMRENLDRLTKPSETNIGLYGGIA